MLSTIKEVNFFKVEPVDVVSFDTWYNLGLIFDKHSFYSVIVDETAPAELT